LEPTRQLLSGIQEARKVAKTIFSDFEVTNLQLRDRWRAFVQGCWGYFRQAEERQLNTGSDIPPSCEVVMFPERSFAEILVLSSRIDSESLSSEFKEKYLGQSGPRRAYAFHMKIPLHSIAAVQDIELFQ